MVTPSETSSSWYERLEAWMRYNRGLAYEVRGIGSNSVTHPPFTEGNREFCLQSVIARVVLAPEAENPRYFALELYAEDEDLTTFPGEEVKPLYSYSMPSISPGGGGTSRNLLWAQRTVSDNWSRTPFDEFWLPANSSYRWRVLNLDPYTSSEDDTIEAIFFFRLR